MTLGLAPRQGDLLATTANYCEGRVAADSIYGVLHRECFRLFPDEMFADLFTNVGRRSVPPMIVAVVMVLQRIEGCSDREAVERFCFDARWKYAAGGLDFDYPGFVHTVLVDMRARLAASDKPERIFEVVLEVARSAGLVGRRRVLDSTPIYDAVATMDTVTLIRSAIRGLLQAAETDLAGQLRAALTRADDYADAGKPVCDYDDPAAREALVDALASDARACLAVLEGRELAEVVTRAAALLATVVGQDLETDADGVFRIARRVARDRVISTVDTETRHGRKTSARGFDGYKGHVAIDPDSELITATTVTAGNVGDAGLATDLLADDLPTKKAPTQDPPPEDPPAEDPPAEDPPAEDPPAEDDVAVADTSGAAGAASDRGDAGAHGAEPLRAYGDAAYGAGALVEQLEEAGAHVGCKVQPPTAPGGRFTKDAFDIDLPAGTVTCPNGASATIRPARDGGGTAHFGQACAGCPLAAQCTTSTAGRTIGISQHEAALARARTAQRDPAWQADYRATRPKVERKIGHLMRRHHGGRRARVRGKTKIAADFSLLAAATNLARLAVLGVYHDHRGWALLPA